MTYRLRKSSVNFRPTAWLHGHCETAEAAGGEVYRLQLRLVCKMWGYLTKYFIGSGW